MSESSHNAIPIRFPRLGPNQPFTMLRPDDLLSLEVTPVNLHLDTSDPESPALVRTEAGSAAYLILSFAPQSIAEAAFFEGSQPPSALNPLPDQPPPPVSPPPADPTSGATLPLPGGAALRMSGESRLVFSVPDDVKSIPYSIQSLLDWSSLSLVLPPAAAVPPGDSGGPGQEPPPIAEPSAQQTAIELPYRLLIAPTVTAGGEPAWVHATGPVASAGRVELWHTRLARRTTSGAPEVVEASHTGPLPLRAVWSPDFVSNGPLPSHDDDNLPFASFDPTPTGVVAAMSPRDRDQIVILTSGFSGYTLSGTPGAVDPYVPVPVEAERLFLSALGGWLSSRGAWPYPVSYTYRPRIILEPPRDEVSRLEIGGTAVQGLDLIEWDHTATQGRDHYVRLVYEGFLYPFGHRASLVKVTERKVLAPNGSAGNPSSSPVAFLRQRMYIIVRERDKTYTGSPYLYAGREMPLSTRVRIKIHVTPDIAEPVPIPGSTSSFWVNQATDVTYPFPLLGTDLAAADVDFLAPLIFMSLSETNVQAVHDEYVSSNPRRRCTTRGRKLAYADPSAGDTEIKTTSLYFTSELAGNAEPPFTEAPFLPVLDSASVVVPSLTALIGQNSAIQIQYYGPYLQNGLDGHAGVFAQLLDTLPVTFSADKTGGLSRPNLGLSALSARKGLVSGSPDDAAAGTINPSQFFGDPDAKLFGTIPLGQLIPVTAGLADAALNAPEIRNRSLPNARHPKQVVTHLTWTPQLTSYSVDPVEVAFDDTSSLTLKVVLTTYLDGTPPVSTGHGRLKNFKLTMVGCIALVISNITFDSSNGSKSTVTLRLANRNPIQFIGPLSFVQQLASILPPGLFGGDGPSIRPTPTALDVSYTLGLPPITAGMFSLQNIAIMAGLDLPYLDGKPAVEFAFASRSRPFLVTVEIFGGGGFVHVVLNADGIVMVEGSIEFGGNFAFDIGVASGGVHAMAGIYFQLAGSNSDLTGFVDIGGEVSVLGLISISLDLNISLSWQHSSSGDVIEGRATMSVSVHVLFFSASVSISVERSFSAGGGDPKIGQLVDAGDWSLYAGAFA